MKSFLKKISTAIASMGKAPYNDRETFEAVSAATKRTVDIHEELKKTKAAKQ